MKRLCIGLLAAIAIALIGIPIRAQDSWRGLRVAPESRCADYDSGDYRYSQRVEDRIIADHGGIFSPYTGEWFDTKRETDIEHIVARSEAHDSGLCSASAATKHQFAEDLLNLTLASPSVNRHQKVAKDAAEWLPDRNKCWFADRVVRVRQKYRLTIDRREAEALESVLSGCSSVEMVVYSTSESAGTSTASGEASSGPGGTHSPPPPPRPPATRSGCGPFKNCTALRQVHPGGVPRGHCAYSSRMDRDKDDWACER